MLNIKRLLELNAELRELNEEGLLDAGTNGFARMHMTEEAFKEITKGMTVYHEGYSEKYRRLSIIIDEVEFFCLEERSKQ